ncbi:Tripeptidyl aminopeptidase [Lachnellula hyalina]|uniref:Tripeptidyl aminopeptidase n=1 Tax=Lachnellula hyalina TaxID=1316788 RepID=A0A8H8TYY0_9HELO|nr:Tripeptidyl aminopeptidase [Lachnellula hyalina]TVY25840.1 Tripeptidyl aminopeptidase [Lachnellula hyalina]
MPGMRSKGSLVVPSKVPLDYQNPTLGRASVPLLKVPAQANSSDGAYQGMLLLNPGGPGGSGVSEALNNGSLIQAILGTNWDIIGFDPRGMWLSQPLANCSTGISTNQSIALSSRSVPRVTDEFYNSQIQYGKEVGAQCEQLTGGDQDAGPHMSTAVNARDMVSIADAFAETADGARASKPSHLVNYYGRSYGTFIGQTFASMFPERVGNVALDGVVGPESYLTNYTTSTFFHTDGVIAAFFVYCHEAGLSQCSYYTGSTAMDIYERFNASFIQLDPRKAEIENWSNATDLEAALLMLKVTMLAIVDEPLSEFSSLSQILLDLESAILAQDISPWTEQVEAIYGDPTTAGDQAPEWTSGVLCADQNNKFYNKTLQDLRLQLNQLEDQSIIGEVWSKPLLECLGWSIKAKEIFSGPFGGDTATPILFVSNTYDPVTPIENSISSVPNYKNAQLLTIDGMGHTASAPVNYCGFAKMKAYFQTSQLPGNDSFCPLEAGPFGIVLNGTLKENIQQAGLSDLVQ